MDRKSWMKILSGCSMASLILAGCGGGGGGGGGAAPIKTVAQAQQAAASTTLVMGDGLSSLVAPGGGSFSKKFAARVASENLPTMEGYFAIQKFLADARKAANVQKAAVTETGCSGGGSIKVDNNLIAGGFKTTTTYTGCREGNILISGISSSQEIIGATSSEYIEIEGNGDQDVDDATDLVMKEFDFAGNVVSTWKASSTDKWTDTVVSDTTSQGVSSFKGKFTYGDDTDSFSLTANMSDTGTTKNILNGYEDDYVTDGTIAFSGSFSGEKIGLSITADNMRSKELYTSTATGQTEIWEASGSFSTSMNPSTCLDGSYKIETIVPVKSENNLTTAGEIKLNGTAKIVMSNNGFENIVTIYLGTNPTAVYSGTEAELVAQTMEDCPIFALASTL